MDAATTEAIARNQQRIAHFQEQLTALKTELAAFEAMLCQCQPQREHDDYRRPAQYLHAASYIVAAAQQDATNR
jgi:hypothetical protein